MVIPLWLEVGVPVLAVFGAFVAALRYYATPRVLVAPLVLTAMMLAAYTVKQMAAPHLPRAIEVSLEAVGRPCIVALAVSVPFVLLARTRTYLLVLRGSVMVIIIAYIVGELIINDFRQGFVQWAYLGILGGYALCAAVTWRLVRYSMAELDTNTPSLRG